MTDRRIAIVAGEASGDLHAAKLIEDTQVAVPGVKFFGIGGSAMRKAGAEILFDSAAIAVVGFLEVLAHFGQIRAAWRTITERLRKDPPNLLVLVDYPGFNLRLARYAKNLRIPVLYYISPQLWAWRQGRVKGIAQSVDMMAVIFPFEVAFYKKHKVPVRFVGHPFTVHAKASQSRAESLQHFGLPSGKKVIGLFPGSRMSEIKRLLPVMVRSAQELRVKHPDAIFVLPIAPTLTEAQLAPYLADHGLPLHCISNSDVYDVIQCCDAIVTASGTATLQIALMGVPMVIVYKMAWLTFAIARFFITIPMFGMANIVAGKKIVQEYAQADAEPHNIVPEISRILSDSIYDQSIRSELALLRDRLRGAEEPIGLLIQNMLKDRSVKG